MGPLSPLYEKFLYVVITARSRARIGGEGVPFYLLSHPYIIYIFNFN